MTQNKTKKALLMSVLSMMLCVAMLVGMTFAWFTDTASTSVNTIQAGNLKISLVDGDGNDLTNKKIQWTAKGADGKQHTVENPLWEPGCTFKTEQFYLKNGGNLALKYKINLSFTGDTKLLEVLEFSAVVSGDNVQGGMIPLKSLDAINGFEGHLLPASESVGETTPEYVGFKITAKMKTSAGNEYQGLTLGEIKVNVVATQYTYEYDSTGNQYDARAEYPVASKDDLTKAIDAINESGTDKASTIVVTDDFTFTDETLTFSKGDVTLDLSGNKLTVSSGDKDGIKVETEQTLRLQAVTVN